MTESNDTVVFMTPYYHTTLGHRNIASLVRRACEILGLHCLLAPNLGPAARALLASEKDRLAAVIVDFPDAGLKHVIQTMRRIVAPETPWLYLGMQQSPECVDYVDDYNAILMIEPRANIGRRDGTPVLEVLPLVNPVSFAPLTEAQTIWVDEMKQLDVQNRLLVLETGLPEERRTLCDYGSALAQRASMTAFYSRSVPQPIGPMLSHFGQIVSALGYSGFWEIISHGLFDRANFVSLDRAAEGCARRLDSYLLGRQITGNERYPFKDETAARVSSDLFAAALARAVR